MTQAAENIVNLPLTKQCTGCNCEKSISEFRVQKNRRKDGTGVGYLQCRECIKKSDKKRYKRKYARSRNYKHRFGVTVEQVQEMLASQMGLCANRGCGTEISLNLGLKMNKRACLDHCHSTGKVRGLLCVRCNTALGMLENKNMILGLTEYLQKHGSQVHV